MEISELIALIGRVSYFDRLFRISEYAHGDGRIKWWRPHDRLAGHTDQEFWLLAKPIPKIQAVLGNKGGWRR